MYVMFGSFVPRLGDGRAITLAEIKNENKFYELQLKGSSAHLEATEKFQSQVTDMMSNLAASVEDTRLYKENMSMLSKNLTDLNNVYGNMLKAMTITRG